MTLYYREHRGSLSESLKTARIIESVSELGEDIVVKNYGYDNRLQSHTLIVLKKGQPVGYITEKI